MDEKDLKLSEIEGLHAKTVGVLEANGIHTVAEFAGTDYREMLQLNGIGEKSLSALRVALREELRELATPKEPEPYVPKPISEAAPMAPSFPGTAPIRPPKMIPNGEGDQAEPLYELAEDKLSKPLPEPREIKVEKIEPMEIYPDPEQKEIEEWTEIVVQQSPLKDYKFDINPSNFARMDRLVVFFLDFLNAIYGEGSGTKFTFNPDDMTQTLARLKMKYPHVFSEWVENAKT